jgi:heme O synthase-like polyprenyltransferase
MSRLRTWLQLFRAPNLFTVPGDPLAGYIVVNGFQISWGVALPILASFCFYGAGLLMNDLADEAEDRRERPQRPLPSGAVTSSSVRAAMITLILAGLGVLYLTHHSQALILGATLVLAMALYNLVTKTWPIVGALNMGACRALSIALGAVSGPLPSQIQSPATIIALLFGIYIAAVTNLAKHETRDHVPALARLLPMVPVALFALIGTALALQAPARTPAVFILALAFGSVMWLAVKMFHKPKPSLPPLIGAHIRVLLPLQAAACYLGEPWDAGRISAIVLLACWPLSRLVSRRFYAS